MITREEALVQIERLNWLPKFPKQDAAMHLEELVKALRSSPSADIAARVIEEFAQGATECPLPVTIRRMVQSYAERSEPDQYQAWMKPPKCDRCKDGGFVVTQKPNGLTGAEPCSCRRGEIWEKRP